MNKRLFFILLILLSILLSSCSDGQLEWAEIFLNTLFTANGFAVEEGLENVDLDVLIGKTVDKAVDQFTNSEEATALDAAEAVLKDIEKADEHLETALSSNYYGPLRDAQSLRPNDVTYVEAELAIWATASNQAAIQSASDKADQITKDFVSQGGNCRSARLNQMRTRHEMLLNQLDHPSVENDSAAQETLYKLIADTEFEIGVLTTGGRSVFCNP